MRRLRRSVRTFDVFWWVDSFFNAAISHDLSAFPAPEEDNMAPEVAADFLPF